MNENSSERTQANKSVRARINSSLDQTSTALRDLLDAGQDLGSVSLSLIQEGWTERTQQETAEEPAPPETAEPEPESAEDEALDIGESISAGISSGTRFISKLFDKAVKFLDREGCGEDYKLRRRRRLYFEIKADEEIVVDAPPPVDIDKVLHIMLTEITATYGLRYNRAALFFREPDQWCLIGRMAIGHVNEQAALKDWEQDRINERDNFDRYLALLDDHILPRTPLEVQIRNLRLPLSEARDDPFSQVILEGNAILVEVKQLDRLPKIFLSIFAPTSEMFIIPIKPGKRVIGLLVVDNKFTGEPLTETDLEVLTTYVETELIAIDERVIYQARKETEDSSTPTRKPPIDALPEEPVDQIQHSDLIRIIGIGDAYEQRLFSAGIYSQAELLEAAATRQGRIETAEAANISYSLILTWANHIDLCRIPGIDEEMAYLLELTGVDTVPELAQRNPNNLHVSLTEVIVSQNKKMRPSVEEIAEWIELAGGMPRVLEYKFR